MIATALSGICSTSGTSFPIEKAIRRPGQAAAVASLRDDGFDSFVLSERNIVDLMAEALRGGLARNHLLPEDVDAVVFATESFWDTATGRHAEVFPEYRRIRDGLLEAMHGIGLRDAYPYANWLSNCANLAPTLALAKGLVESGQHERVLVVVADKQPPGLDPLMENGAAVYSDMAVCCTLDQRDTGFAVERIVTMASPGLAAMRSADAAANFVLETNRAVRRLARKFRAATGKGCDAYRLILANNYHTQSLKVICDSLGIDVARVRRDTRAEVAHGHAGDTLMTLDRLSREAAVEEGEEVLLLTTGLYSWNLVVLRKLGS